jgi:hypothetical protein
MRPGTGRTHRMRRALLLLIFAVAASAQTRYSWQWKDTDCDYHMTFCWDGPFADNSDEVTAWGNHWVSQDKNEKPLEWVTEVRCVKSQRVCILARNQTIGGGGPRTNIDLYIVREWKDYQIRADEEGSGLLVGCEQDSLLINRADASVSMLSNPGPAAATVRCQQVMKPKTVIYKLEQ